MFGRYGVWRSASLEVRFSIPQTTKELLTIEGLASCYLVPRHKQGKSRPSPDHMRVCRDWVQPYIVSNNEGHTTEELLYWRLSPAQIVDLAVSVRNEAALDTDVFNQIKEAAKITALGGCDCRICSGMVLESDIDAHTRSLCKYSGLGEVANGLMVTASPLRDGDKLNAPFWVFQVEQALVLGRGEGRQEQEQRARIRERIRKNAGRS